MTATSKLDEAYARFEQALIEVESITQLKIEESRQLKVAVSDSNDNKQEQMILHDQLSQVRQKAAELVDTSKQAAGKIDTAMGRIRAVLHSNSGS